MLLKLLNLDSNKTGLKSVSRTWQQLVISLKYHLLLIQYHVVHLKNDITFIVIDELIIEILRREGIVAGAEPLLKAVSPPHCEAQT